MKRLSWHPAARTLTFVVGSCLMTFGADALAGDAVDTRVTFTVADDNLRAGPEDSSSASPSLPNSLPSGSNRLFFDDFERRDRGFENLTHLVMYAHEPGFFAGLDTEAALVMRAEVKTDRSDKDIVLSDDGSYLKLSQDLGETAKLMVTAFPVSADRFRLGYSYDISWGGNAMFGRHTKVAPGLRFDLKGEGYYAFIGGKTSVAQLRRTDGSVEEDTVWGLLAGAGIDVVDELRLEGGAGFFEKGIIDKLELQLPEGDSGRFNRAPWQGYGAAGQLTFHVGIPIGTPVDFRLYKNDPLKQQSFFKPEIYNDETSFLVRSEASVLGQTVQDPTRPKQTVNQTAMAADFTATIKEGKLRLHALAVFRNLAFILYNVPSFPSFVDFPEGIETQPEAFLSAGADYYLEDLHLTPGVLVGVQRPANMTSAPDTGNAAPASAGQQTFVFRSDTELDILEAGEKVQPIFAAKLTFKWDLSEIMSAAGELQYSYDPNRRTFAQDAQGIPVRLKEDPTILGFNVMLQSRF